jgi:AGZA family xanthine/uracil permease-like MFS transporter
MSVDASAAPAAPVRLREDVIGGVTTFFTMAYIIVVNPQILSTEGTGMPFAGVLAATVLTAATMTLLMGLYAKIPFAVAPGMGINAFFTYTIVLGQKVPWPVALGIVFWAGVTFLVISVTPIRAQIACAIPPPLRSAAAAGIGVFLTFIGLRNAGLVVASPATFVTVGKVGVPQLLALGGLVVMVAWSRRRSPFALLGGMALVTAAGWLLGLVHAPAHLVSPPDFGAVMFKLDILGALRPALAPALIAILFTDLFDSLSTFVGVAHATGLVDAEGHPRRLSQGLVVDALATLSAGLFGTSSGTAYIESAAGIEAGGRTGRASVVTAACFVPCLFLSPVAAMVPPFATAPVLILVGALMFRSVGKLDLSRLEDAVPAFLTVVLIPLTFSIAQGMLWGFLAHVVLYALAGRRREIQPTMYGIAAVSVVLLVLQSR